MPLVSVDGAVPSVALAIYAHPDDPQVSAGGTLAKWAQAGSAVHLLISTKGEKGSTDGATDGNDLEKVRAAEVACAAEASGLAGYEILEIGDGEVENSPALRRILVERIRAIRPAAVLCHDPTAVFFGDSYLNHRDHRELGWAGLDVCGTAAGSPLYFPDAGQAFGVELLYLSGTLDADTYIDIGESIDAKVEALSCHRSQVGDDRDFVRNLVVSRARETGQMAGVEYAEAFRRLSLA